MYQKNDEPGKIGKNPVEIFKSVGKNAKSFLTNFHKFCTSPLPPPLYYWSGRTTSAPANWLRKWGRGIRKGRFERNRYEPDETNLRGRTVLCVTKDLGRDKHGVGGEAPLPRGCGGSCERVVFGDKSGEQERLTDCANFQNRRRICFSFVSGRGINKIAEYRRSDVTLTLQMHPR